MLRTAKRKHTGELGNDGALPPDLLIGGTMGADLLFQKRITGNLMVYQDRLEAYLLLLFAHPQISEWFSVIYAIIIEVNIVAK